MTELMTDRVSVIRPASDSTGTFDPDDWGIDAAGLQTTLYSGAAMISQDQDMPALASTEGYEQLTQQYVCGLPQDASCPEVVAGDIIRWDASERSPQMVGETFIAQGERHGTLRIRRKIIMQRRETRTQL